MKERTYTETEIKEAMEKVLELARRHAGSEKEFEEAYGNGMGGAINILSIWLFTK